MAPTTTWEARARRGLSALTGRDRHLAVLEGLVEQAAEGHGQVVGLVGDPGVGKSRLVYELARSVPTGWSLVTCTGGQTEGITPFGAVRGAVLQALGLPAGSSADLVTEALHRPRPDRPAIGADDASALAAVLGVDTDPRSAPRWEALDPGVRRRRSVAAVVGLLLDRALSAPLLLVVEDAHWLDGESLTVVESLADRVPGASVLLAVTYRPEYRPAWQHRGHVTVLPLEPLAEPEALSLTTALLGPDPTVSQLSEHLARWAGGVPLFIEETVRALADDGRLVGEPGAYRLTAPVGALRLPARVHGVVAARIDRLPVAQKRLLQAAAVVGSEAPVSVLRDVVAADDPGEEDPREDDPGEVEDAFGGLLGSQLLYERRRGTERRYLFKHALVQEAAHASLTRARRRQLHARVVDVVRARPPEGLDDRLDLLAHHTFEAGQWEQAVELLTEAGDRAQQRCAYREAAALLTRALEAQRRLPPDPAAEVDLLVRLRPALHTLSDFDGVLAHLDRAEELAATMGDRRRLLLVALHRSYTMDTRGHVTGALAAGERALEIALELDDALLASEARMALGQAHAFVGDAARAVPLLEHDAALRRGLLREERLGMGFSRPVFASALVATAQAVQGSFDRARRSAAEAASLLTPAQRPLDVSGVHLAQGLIHLEQGSPREAVPEFEAAYDLCTGMGVVMVAQWYEPRLGEALARAGRLDEARPHLMETLRQAEEHDAPLWRAWALCGLIHLALAEGRPDEAAQHAGRLAELADTWCYPQAGLVARRLGAEAALATGEIAAAEALARDAVARADRTGARPERVRAGLALAAVFERTGRAGEAGVLAARAREEGSAIGLRDLARDPLTSRVP